MWESSVSLLEISTVNNMWVRCLESSQHPDSTAYTLTVHSTGNVHLFLFLFLQVQCIQIYLHCLGVCGDIYLHVHVSQAGGKNQLTNYLYL